MCPDEIALFSGEAVYWFGLFDSHFPRVVDGFDDFLESNAERWRCVDAVYLLKKAFVVRPAVLTFLGSYRDLLAPEGAPVWTDQYGLDETEYLTHEGRVALARFRAPKSVDEFEIGRAVVPFQVVRAIRARNRWARYPQ